MKSSEMAGRNQQPATYFSTTRDKIYASNTGVKSKMAEEQGTLGTRNDAAVRP